MYSEKVMDHFQHPRNVGEIEDASGVGTVGNAKCGDIMRMFLDIDDETHIDETTKEDLDFVVEKLKEIVQYLRSMSPLYEDFMKKQQQ